jgi:hypothetical protein
MAHEGYEDDPEHKAWEKYYTDTDADKDWNDDYYYGYDNEPRWVYWADQFVVGILILATVYIWAQILRAVM